MNSPAGIPIPDHLAIQKTKKRPFRHRLKEKFHQFQFNFYKEREMSDFRKLLLAFAGVALFAGARANAQVIPPIVCSTTAQPLTVRAEGLTEQTGDVVISCQGGQVLAANAPVPFVNIQVSLSVNITSRLVADPITEALLFIDDPQPVQQSPCAPGTAGNAPASGTTQCQGLVASGTVAGAAADSVGGVIRNVFQGVRQNDNTVVFLAIPISAPAFRQCDFTGIGFNFAADGCCAIRLLSSLAFRVMGLPARVTTLVRWLAADRIFFCATVRASCSMDRAALSMPIHVGTASREVTVIAAGTHRIRCRQRTQSNAPIRGLWHSAARLPSWLSLARCRSSSPLSSSR